ncbi:two-component system regulatory protein YycI [Nosocomiicoccus ampullae]|uniref:Regulatory protein YycI of two-component signal transduction system YycFG n=1 Tax=Nosocomiicoccus ampullae TaxID=489910 RepID=A0A9Q2HEM3_9STAP|nr:two-component system regulatory protein YycI [Nosocomiicoccus ampullae]MBB5175494.1 regulatory protein YycI of two-component signal transduction system YycFG [Nosocomiicoccus ampullae]QYA46904.1 two-component system regulatory protein YycI [Nosocomiicoccus ampullae]
MDWKLSKSIYIFVFLIINIVLIIVLYNQNKTSDSMEIKTNKTVQKSDDYKTNVNTTEEIKLTVLNGTRKEFQSATSSEESTNQGMLKSIRKVQSLDFEPSHVQEYVNQEMYKGSEYTYNSDTSNKEILYFNQMHNSLPIFNNSAARIKAVNKDEGIQLEQGYIENISANEYSKKEPVNDPLEAVEELMKEKEISKEAIILSSTLGYYLVLLHDNSNQVLLRPKWKLIIEEKDITRVIYVDAINASEEIIEGE